MMENYLLRAKHENYALGSFNVNTYDEMVALCEMAARLGQPLILMASMSCARFMGEKTFVKLVQALNDAYPIDVYSHLDHCTDQELLLRCVDAGFDSVMFDGSHRPFAENLQITSSLSAYCHERGVLLEGELGVIAGEEGPVKSKFSEFTDPDQAECFVRESGVDFFAVSIGNAHGFYKGEPKLHFDLLEELVRRCPVPLVLHGGTGIPQEDIRRAIAMGICKVNVGTEIRSAYVSALYSYTQTHEKGDVRDFVKYLRAAVGTASERYMECFAAAK